MSDFKIGNTPQPPIHEQPETCSDAVDSKRDLEPGAPLNAKNSVASNLSQTLDPGISEHVFKQPSVGGPGQGGPQLGNFEGGMRPASEWLLQQGKLPESGGITPMGVLRPGGERSQETRLDTGRRLDAVAAAPQGGGGGGNVVGEGIPDIPLTNRPATMIPLPTVVFDEVLGKVVVPIPSFPSTPPPPPDPGPVMTGGSPPGDYPTSSSGTSGLAGDGTAGADGADGADGVDGVGGGETLDERAV
jgi:hypothetical protein